MGIRYEGEMQRLVMLNTEPVPSRRPGCSGEQAIYVEYIETAPWNQAAYAGGVGQYQAVGLALLSIAVEASISSGCDGRLALHALPQSEGFYRRIFEDLGMDREENLRYFEMDSEKAQWLLQRENR
jgi:hypothetical protein